MDILDIDFGMSAAPPAPSATASGTVDLLAGPNTLPSPLSPITITPSLSSNTSATSVSAQPPPEVQGFSTSFSTPNHQQPAKEGGCGQCGCGQCGCGRCGCGQCGRPCLQCSSVLAAHFRMQYEHMLYTPSTHLPTPISVTPTLTPPPTAAQSLQLQKAPALQHQPLGRDRTASILK